MSFFAKLFGRGETPRTSETADITNVGPQPKAELASDVDVGPEILGLFRRERADGEVKIGDGYWGVGENNVGLAIIEAVDTALDALLKSGDRPITLTRARTIIEQSRAAYGHEDADGFGSGTFHGLIQGVDDLIESSGPDARFSPSIAFMPMSGNQSDTDLVAWIANVHERLRNYSAVLGEALDLFAGGEFEAVPATFMENGGLVDGMRVSTTLLMVNCIMRTRGIEEAGSLVDVWEDDFVVRDLSLLLMGKMAITRFSELYDDDVMMCTGCYQAACFHLHQKQFSQAEALLQRCLSYRQPIPDSVLAWYDLISINPTLAR